MACLSHSASQTRPMAESTRPFLFNRVQFQVLVRFSLDSPSYLSVSDVLTSLSTFIFSSMWDSPVSTHYENSFFFFFFFWLFGFWNGSGIRNTRRVPRLVRARAHIMWEIALTHATCLWFLCPAVSQ